MPEANRRPCPVCGEPLSRRARRCSNCGSKIPREDAAVEAPEIEEPPQQEAEASQESAVLYLCPNCGAFTDSTSEVCPKCGKPLHSDEAALEESTLCPQCGSTIHISAEICPSCETPLREPEPEPVPPPEPVPEPVAAAVAGPMPSCAVCGAVLPPSEEVCGICGTPRSAPEAERLLKALSAPLPPPPPPDDEVFDDLELGLAEPEPVREEGARPPPPTAPKLEGVEPIAPERERDLQRHLEELLTLVDTAEEGSPKLQPLRRAPAPPRGARPQPAPEAEPPKRRQVARPRTRPRTEQPTAPRVTAPIVPTRTRRPSRYAALRDVAAISTAFVMGAAVAATAAALDGREWGLLLAFGFLLNISVGTTLPDLRPQPSRRSAMYEFGIGGALLGLAPIAGYATGSDVIAMPIAAGGALLVFAAAWALRRTIGVFLPWMGGLALLTALAISPFVLTTAGSATVETSLWAMGGVMAVLPAALVPYRRSVTMKAERAVRRGDEAFAKHEYEAALRAYDDAIDLGRRAGRDVVEAWYGRGSTLVQRNRNEEALLALDRALALNPTNEVAWVNKGSALAKMNRIPDALRCYNSAIKINPQYEVAWNNKGNALARMGRHDRALECYERAINIDEEYRTAWVNRGFVLAKLGRFEEAAACADRARRLTSEAVAAA